MYLVCDELFGDPRPVGIFSSLDAAKKIAKEGCGRNREGEWYVFCVPTNKKWKLDRGAMIGWCQRLIDGKVTWHDCEGFLLQRHQSEPLDQLAEDLMSRDPLVCDMARDILGRQDL